MLYLVAITLLWAFSFSLIGEYLSGQVDNDFAVLTRVLLAAAVFVPMLRWRGLPAPLLGGMIVIGMLQFGITYLCLYRSFGYLTVPEVLLFTITTPLYVALIDDALRRRFSPVALLAALLAVIGAGVIRYDGVTGDFVTGLLLLQIANAAFAAGQVGYKHLTASYPVAVPAYRYFGYFFIGGALVSVPSFLVFGDTTMLPATAWQWSILAWLGLVATGLGLFLWNHGACQVDAGTLAVMNNALIPAGLLVNLVIWNQDADLLRLAMGGAIMAAALWVNARWSSRAVVSSTPPAGGRP